MVGGGGVPACSGIKGNMAVFEDNTAACLFSGQYSSLPAPTGARRRRRATRLGRGARLGDRGDHPPLITSPPLPPPSPLAWVTMDRSRLCSAAPTSRSRATCVRVRVRERNSF